jgi:Holliday junction resolvasome RuvABC endonuclease subunit
MVAIGTYAIGIDPGKTGGIALIQVEAHGFRLVSATRMPIDANERIDVLALVSLLEKISPTPYRQVFIEKAFAGVGQMGTRVTSFTIGLNYGRILAALDLAGIEYTEIMPRNWQSKVLKDAVGNDSKEKACSVFARLCSSSSRVFALTPRSRKPHEGIVDASLLGYWGVTETPVMKKV